jgi:hypothetical protein
VTAFNVFMAIFLLALIAGTILVMRYLILNPDKVGEARFDTRNKGDVDG